MSQFDLFSSSPKANRFESLDEVIDALKQMKDDPLADAGTNVVVSRGNPNARLLLIGEAPVRGKYQGKTVCRARRSDARQGPSIRQFRS